MPGHLMLIGSTALIFLNEKLPNANGSSRLPPSIFYVCLLILLFFLMMTKPVVV